MPRCSRDWHGMDKIKDCNNAGMWVGEKPSENGVHALTLAIAHDDLTPSTRFALYLHSFLWLSDSHYYWHLVLSPTPSFLLTFLFLAFTLFKVRAFPCVSLHLFFLSSSSSLILTLICSHSTSISYRVQSRLYFLLLA